MKKTSVAWFVLIQWVLAFEWLHSGWGKWSGSGFMTNINKTLSGFSTKNPNTWYANFLNNTAVPNAEVFGNVIRSSELLVGIALALAGILLLTQKRLHPLSLWVLVIACFGGALMNLNFFLASGWTSPSTWGVNVVMGLVQLILGLHYLLNRKELTN